MNGKAGEDWRRLRGITGRAVENQELLRTTQEWHFVYQLHEKLLAWREETFISHKQLRWLHSIDEHLDREGVGHDGLTATDEKMRERDGGMSRWRC